MIYQIILSYIMRGDDISIVLSYIMRGYDMYIYFSLLSDVRQITNKKFSLTIAQKITELNYDFLRGAAGQHQFPNINLVKATEINLSSSFLQPRNILFM